MTPDPVATRYAQALFETVKAEGRIDETLEQLILIGQLMNDHPDLRQLMLNPDVDPDDKVGVLDRLLKGSWSDVVLAFVRMLITLGRAEHLPKVVETFQAAVDAERGHLRVVVRSAHPLPEAVLTRLRVRLEQQERKQVDLETEIAQELLGGLQVRLDHRAIDGSVQRQLVDLRQRLKAIRVH
jgi:F-type H+-transporting ATPase subunit delta